MAKRTTKTNKPVAWQTNPAYITTDMVQYWLRGSFVKVTKAEAITKINQGKAFVISGQAIGALVNGKMES